VNVLLTETRMLLRQSGLS